MARAPRCPKQAAIVTESPRYQWTTTRGWSGRRGADPHNGPMSIYEVHLGSWRQGLGYVDLAEHLVNYVRDLGFTHVELPR